jgi:hypothetical protein
MKKLLFILIAIISMSYGLKYRMKFTNREGQAMRLQIWDAHNESISNPYNVQYTETFPLPGDPPGTPMIVSFTFNNPGPDVDSVIIGYSSDNGSNWTDVPGAPVSPRIIFIPAGNYIYRIQFHHLDDSVETFYLNDLTVQVIDLEAADDAIEENVINNSQNKYEPIRAKQLIFRFKSNANIQLSNFLKDPAEDTRYYVEADVNEKIFFKGFLLLDDLQEPYLSPANIVEMKATDRLGTLKDVPLTDFANENPKGKKRIADFFAFCFSKTGLNLPINVIDNIREEHDIDGHWYDKIYQDAKTFEDKIGSCINCYEALSRLLRFRGFTTQERGEWWIKRIDEFDMQPDYVRIFNSDGTIGGTPPPLDVNKRIGKNEKIFVINKATTVMPVRPNKMNKLTYKYIHPQEVLCNVDFSRGALIDGSDPLSQKFDIECWEKLWSNTSSDDPEPTGIYLRRIYSFPGYEKERYVQIEASTSHFRFIMSEAIPMNAKDKFTLSVSRRLSSDVSGTGFFRDGCVQVRLYGEDGTYWTHHGKTSVGGDAAKWVACDASFRTNSKFFCYEGDGSEDQSEAKELYDGESAELPVGGEIKILIYASALWGGTRDTFIDKVNIDIHEFINGSYEKYTGQSNKVTKDGDYFAKLDEEIGISDSPRIIFKGALLYKDNNDKFQLAGRFFNAAVFPGGPPDETYLHPYSYIQIFDVHNQYNRVMRIIHATMMGLGKGEVDVMNRTDTPGLLHKYSFTDESEHGRNKYYMLLSYQKNWKTCQWNGVFAEVYDRMIGKKYDDDWLFRYES